MRKRCLAKGCNQNGTCLSCTRCMHCAKSTDYVHSHEIDGYRFCGPSHDSICRRLYHEQLALVQRLAA
jgi:hypothetical protein